jgi:hypothetical protein
MTNEGMRETDEAMAGETEHREALALAHALVGASTRDWQTVARGEADRAEVAAQRAAAGDSPTAISLAERLFAPYDELEQRRLVDALLSASREPGADVPPASPAADPSRRRRLVPSIMASLAALAAALLLAFVSFGPALRGSGQPREPIAALPSYALEPGDGLATSRSTPHAGPPRYASTSAFAWTLRPEFDVEGPLPLVLGRAIDAEGHAHALPLRPETARSGVVQLRGRIDELELAPGAWTIELVVVRMIGERVELHPHALPIVIEP